MNAKSLVWGGVFVGTTAGSALPLLWGASVFSVSSVVWSMIGGLAGIWIGWKLSHMF